MSKVNKRLIALAMSALDRSTQNESDFVITSNRIDIPNEPTLKNIEYKGKKAKKGKSLKDWE